MDAYGGMVDISSTIYGDAGRLRQTYEVNFGRKYLCNYSL